MNFSDAFRLCAYQVLGLDIDKAVRVTNHLQELNSRESVQITHHLTPPEGDRIFRPPALAGRVPPLSVSLAFHDEL